MNQNTPAFFARLRELVAAGQLDEATNLLRQLLQNSPRLDDALQQSGRLSDIERQIRLGTVSHENATVTKNQIRMGILGLLTEIEASIGAGGDNAGGVLNPAGVQAMREEVDKAVTTVNNQGTDIKNQFIGGTFNNPTFN